MVAGSTRRAVGAVAVRVALPVVGAVLAAPAMASDTAWNKPNGGVFSVAANWTAGVPDSAAAALFNSFFTIQTVQFTTSPTVGRLELGKGLITFALGAKTLKAVGLGDGQPSIRVGSLPGSIIFLNLQGGLLAGEDVVIGDVEGAIGSVFGGWLGQPTRLLVGDLVVGRAGTGTLSGGIGSQLEADSLTIGLEPGSTGDVFTGAFDTSTTVRGACIVGQAGKATLDVRLGALMTVEGSLTAAVESGSSATIRCSDDTAVLHVLGDAAWGIDGTASIVCIDGGRIRVDGSLVASDSASIGIEIGPGSLDGSVAIDAGGSFELFLGETDAGSLPTPVTVTIRAGYQPPIGAVASLLRSGLETAWPLVTLPATTVARRYETLVTPTSVDLLVSAGSGDLNGDHAIDAADLAILLAAWGGGEVDFNGDTITDGADLAMLLGAIESTGSR